MIPRNSYTVSARFAARVAGALARDIPAHEGIRAQSIGGHIHRWFSLVRRSAENILRNFCLRFEKISRYSSHTQYIANRNHPPKRVVEART